MVRQEKGLAPPPALHPLQQAFIDEQAPHCGYCTNGMIIKGSELLAGNPRPTEAQIRTAMDGHLCRCGTYPRVMKAIQVASRGFLYARKMKTCAMCIQTTMSIALAPQ